MNRQRLMLHSVDGMSLETVEGAEVLAGRSVCFAPDPTMPRSYANWVQHRACLVAAPAMADTLEKVDWLLREYGRPGGMSKFAVLETLLRLFNGAEVRALLASVEQ